MDAGATSQGVAFSPDAKKRASPRQRGASQSLYSPRSPRSNPRRECFVGCRYKRAKRWFDRAFEMNADAAAPAFV